MKRVQKFSQFKRNLLYTAIAATMGGVVVQAYGAPVPKKDTRPQATFSQFKRKLFYAAVAATMGGVVVQAYAAPVPKEDTRPQATDAVTLEPQVQNQGTLEPRQQINNQFAQVDPDDPDNIKRNPVILEGFGNFADQLNQLMPGLPAFAAPTPDSDNHVERVLHPAQLDNDRNILMLHPDAGLLILKNVISNEIQANQQNQNLQPLLENVCAQDWSFNAIEGRLNAGVPRGEVRLDGATDIVTQGLGAGDSPWGWVIVHQGASLKIAAEGEEWNEGIHAANVSIHGGKLVGVHLQDADDDTQAADDDTYVTISPTDPVYIDKDGHKAHYAKDPEGLMHYYRIYDDGTYQADPEHLVLDTDIRTFGLRRVELDGDQEVRFRISAYNPEHKDTHFDELLVAGKNNKLDLRRDRDDRSYEVRVPVVKVNGDLVTAVNDGELVQNNNTLLVHEMVLGEKAGGQAYAEYEAQEDGPVQYKKTAIPVVLHSKDENKGQLTIHKGYEAGLYVIGEGSNYNRNDNDGVMVDPNQVNVYGTLYGLVGGNNKVVADGAVIRGGIVTDKTFSIVNELKDTVVKGGSFLAGNFNFKGEVTLEAKKDVELHRYAQGEQDDPFLFFDADAVMVDPYLMADPYQMRIEQAHKQNLLALNKKEVAEEVNNAAQRLNMEQLKKGVQDALDAIRPLEVAVAAAPTAIQAAAAQLKQSELALVTPRQAFEHGKKALQMAEFTLVEGKDACQKAEETLQRERKHLEDLERQRAELAPGGSVTDGQQPEVQQVNKGIATARTRVALLQTAANNAQAAIAPAAGGNAAGGLQAAVDDAEAAIAAAVDGNPAGALRQSYDAALTQVDQHKEALAQAEEAVSGAEQNLQGGKNAIVQARRVVTQAEADRLKAAQELQLAQSAQQHAADTLRTVQQFDGAGQGILKYLQAVQTERGEDWKGKAIRLSDGHYKVLANSTLAVDPEKGACVVVDGEDTELRFEGRSTLALTVPDLQQAPLMLVGGARLVLSDEKGTALEVSNAAELIERSKGEPLRVKVVSIDEGSTVEGKFRSVNGVLYLYDATTEMSGETAGEKGHISLNLSPVPARDVAGRITAELGGSSEVNKALANQLESVLVAEGDGLSDRQKGIIEAVQSARYNGAVSTLANELAPESSLNGGNVRLSRSVVTAAQTNIANHLESASLSGVTTGDAFDSQGVWGEYIHINGKQDNKDNVSGYDAKYNGITIGWDAELNDSVTSGFAFTYVKTDLDTKDVQESTKGDQYMGTFYVGWVDGPWFANGMLSYAQGKNDYKSHITATSQNLKGDGDAKTWAFTVGGGYNIPIDEQWILQPKAQFNYINASVDDYKLRDDSGVFNSKISTDDFQVMELGVGIRAVGDIAMEEGKLMPEFRLMGYYDFNDKRYQGDHQVLNTGGGAVGSATSFEGVKRERARGVAGLGMTYAANENLSVGLDYDYHFEDGYKAHSVMAKISYDF